MNNEKYRSKFITFLLKPARTLQLVNLWTSDLNNYSKDLGSKLQSITSSCSEKLKHSIRSFPYFSSNLKVSKQVRNVFDLWKHLQISSEPCLLGHFTFQYEIFRGQKTISWKILALVKICLGSKISWKIFDSWKIIHWKILRIPVHWVVLKVSFKLYQHLWT